jgi:hypothetical protein
MCAPRPEWVTEDFAIGRFLAFQARALTEPAQPEVIVTTVSITAMARWEVMLGVAFRWHHTNEEKNPSEDRQCLLEQSSCHERTK